MLRQNERSWAIEVITAINQYCSHRNRLIYKASGECGLRVNDSILFPDIFLTTSDGSVLHGWEVKMPEVPVTDANLIHNAKIKAQSLSSNSFLLWNCKEAVLYKAEDNFETYLPIYNWSEPGLATRNDVSQNPTLWKDLLFRILNDLNNFFDQGQIRPSRPEIVFGDNLFSNIINLITPSDTDSLRQAVARDADLDAEIDRWWSVNESEHVGQEKISTLAKVNITNWLNRLLFCHYLKKFHDIAQLVDGITVDTTFPEAIAIFERISNRCDFLNVFTSSVADTVMSASGWNTRVRFNALLTDLRIDELPQSTLSNLLENALEISRRKLAGQFSTPLNLARLLVRLTVNDRSLPVIDTCCGTGTIIRAVYDLKRSLGFSVSNSLSTIWASDKFQFPLQLTSIALTNAEAIGEVVQVFRSDVFDLTDLDHIDFIDPSDDGVIVERAIPKFHAIVSNLPFVRFEQSSQLNPNQVSATESFFSRLGSSLEIDGRADLYAFIIPCLYNLLQENGRVGLITSNSWLGTDWGVNFRNILSSLFRIKQVVISGNGRWFTNSKVVTTIMILEKRHDFVTPPDNSEITNFCVTNNNISEWEPPIIRSMSNSIRNVHPVNSNLVSIQPHSLSEIREKEQLGFGWTSLFVNTNWYSQLESKLIKASAKFSINRGERRGWDDFFYPSINNGIEEEYLQPVLLSSRTQNYLLASPDGQAFCCSRSETELTGLGHLGAIRWINRFRHITNGNGLPLPEVLARSNMHWYEMKPDTRAILALSMNPGEVLEVFRFESPTFVNQRLIRFSQIGNPITSVRLEHALLNSIVGLFFIEANGFGRGLGALDLNATKLRTNLMMLNPLLLSEEAKLEILDTFSFIENREIYSVPSEMDANDRVEFDRAILRGYGIEHLYSEIRSALFQLFNIRNTARG